MTQAITRCPACGMSFRVSETQLRVADGAVRCGSCLHVFQAEEFFISPMLDVTEQIAIQEEYWETFDEYLFQVFEPEVAEQDVQADEPLETEEENLTEASDIVQPGTDEEPVATLLFYEPKEVSDEAEDQVENQSPSLAVQDRSEDEAVAEEDSFPSSEESPHEYLSQEEPTSEASSHEEVHSEEPSSEDPSSEDPSSEESESDVTEPPVYDPDDIVPVLSDEIAPEEFEEAFANYADAGLIPIDTVQPDTTGQQDLFSTNDDESERGSDVISELAGSPAVVSTASSSSDDDSTENLEHPESSENEKELMDFYLDFVDQHPSNFVETIAVESPKTDASEEVEEALPVGLTIIETRDEEDSELDSLALDVADDPDELTAPRRGGVTNAMIGWFAASLGMLAIGVAQYLFYNKDVYAQVEDYRPWYLSTCRYLGCELPEYDRIELLKTRELIVRTHPSEPDALTVDVLLSNNGDFRQLFPGLELTFFNIQGEKTASRVFTVSEYLGGELRGLRFIPARTEVRLSLELVDPGNEALGYEMQVVPL